MKKLHEVIEILMKYQDETIYNIVAEHDIIYLEGPRPERLSEEHKIILSNHGCVWDDALESWHMWVS